MRFEILRTSDTREGRQGRDTRAAGPPHKSATWNPEENRWEVSIATLEELLTIMVDTETYILVALPLPAEQAHGDLPILELQDDTRDQG